MARERVRNLLSESSLAKRRSFVKSFVKEIKVTGDRVMLTYTIPLAPKGLTAEEMPVLSTVHFGGAEGVRAPDLLNANQALSRLSYSPKNS